MLLRIYDVGSSSILATSEPLTTWRLPTVRCAVFPKLWPHLAAYLRRTRPLLVPFSPQRRRFWLLVIFRRRNRCLQILSSQRTGALRLHCSSAILLRPSRYSQ